MPGSERARADRIAAPPAPAAWRDHAQQGRLYAQSSLHEGRLRHSPVQFPRRRVAAKAATAAAKASCRTPPRRSTGSRQTNPNAASCWIAGFSFGAWNRHAAPDAPSGNRSLRIDRAAANVYDFTFLAPCPSSGLIVQGDKDEVVPQEFVHRAFREARQAA
jgi:hypothetical protein